VVTTTRRADGDGAGGVDAEGDPVGRMSEEEAVGDGVTSEGEPVGDGETDGEAEPGGSMEELPPPTQAASARMSPAPMTRARATAGRRGTGPGGVVRRRIGCREIDVMAR